MAANTSFQGKHFLSELLTLKEEQQKEQIAKADPVAVVELFSQFLDLERENTSGLNQLEEYALGRVKQLQDKLNSAQIGTIQTLCLEKLSSLDAKQMPKLKDAVMDFLSTGAAIDKNNVIEMIRYAHENQSKILLQRCFNFIKTATNTTLSCTDFGNISIKINQQNNDSDLNELSKYIPLLTAAIGKDNNNVQIEIIPGKSLDIKNLIPFVNENSKHIHTLDLREKQVTDPEIKKLLKDCNNLNHLFIKSNKIGGEGLQEINHLTNLQTLDLSSCFFLTTLPDLAALKELKTLKINHCFAITSVNIAALTKLQILDLSYCELLTSVNLAELTSLIVLNLDHSSKISSVTLTALTSLQTLDFRDNVALTYLKLTALTKLLLVNLSYCRALLSVDIAGLTSLQTLSFRYCSALTSVNIKELKNLRSIDFCGCKALISLPDLEQLRAATKRLREIDLPDFDQLSPKISFLLSLWSFHVRDKIQSFFCKDLTQTQKDDMIQYWMSEFAKESAASSSNSASQGVPENLNKFFETYNALKSSSTTNPRPTLEWMGFALLRLATLDESARKWLLDKGILDEVRKFQNPAARYPIAEIIFRVAEDSGLRANLDANEKGITDRISGRRDLKSLLPYLIVALQGKGVDSTPLEKVLENLRKTLLADSAKYGIIFTLFTNLYFLTELERKQITTLIKAIYNQSHSNGELVDRNFLKRCSDVSTLIGFEAFDKLLQKELEIEKAVGETFTEAIAVNIVNLAEKFNNTYGAWRNPFGIIHYASRINALKESTSKVHLYNTLYLHLCSLVTATLEDKFSEFRYDLERVPDLRAIDKIDSNFLTIWKDPSAFPPRKWSPSDSTQKKDFNAKSWLLEKLVKFKHVADEKSTEHILQFLEGDERQQDKIAQNLAEQIKVNKNDQKLRIQDLCIRLYRAESDEEKRKHLKSLSVKMKGKKEYENFLNDITAELTSNGGKKGEYVIYVSDHPSDLLNIGEMGGSCQNIITANITTSQGVLGSSSTGTFQLIVMKSAYGPMEKSVSRILIHTHPHDDEIAIYAEGLYDDTKLHGVDKALMDYAETYVKFLGTKCVLVCDKDLGGIPYGPLKSEHSGPPVYVDSAKGIQYGPYTIPNSYRYS